MQQLRKSVGLMGLVVNSQVHLIGSRAAHCDSYHYSYSYSYSVQCIITVSAAAGHVVVLL